MKFYHRCIFLSSLGVVLCVVGGCILFTAFSSSSSSSSSSLETGTVPSSVRRNAVFLSRDNIDNNNNNNNNNQQSSIPDVFPHRRADADASCPASLVRFADVDFNTLHLYEFLNMTGRGGGDEDWMDLNFRYDVNRWRHDPLKGKLRHRQMASWSTPR